MQALSYYLLYPLVLLISYSPFWLLYRLSDLLYLLLCYGIRYRRRVIVGNLRRSFPDYSDDQIKQTTRAFYRYLGDLIVETLKTLTWKEEHVRQRVSMHNTALLDELYAQGKSIVIVMGHLGNWEWAGPCFSLNCPHQLLVVYRPLSNPYFEKAFARARSKFGTQIVAKSNTLRGMVARRKTTSATALIADQAPFPAHTGFWINFLHQDTLVFAGPEKIAKKFDYPVVYMDVQRVRRGHYEVHPTLLFAQPNETSEHQITVAFNKILEEGIRKRPETWLWSHKRWKHTRPH